jgi:hypothetical protein
MAISVTLQDYKGKTGVVTLDGPKTLTNAKTLADFLKTHSDAKVVSYGVSLDYSGDDTSNGKYDRVLQRLKFSYEKTDGKNVTFSYPAPRDEDVSDDQEPTSGLAEDVKDLLNQLGVKIATYNGGGMVSRMPSKESRSKSMTGI